jgi:hypothetical protein
LGVWEFIADSSFLGKKLSNPIVTTQQLSIRTAGNTRLDESTISVSIISKEALGVIISFQVSSLPALTFRIPLHQQPNFEGGFPIMAMCLNIFREEDAIPLCWPINKSHSHEAGQSFVFYDPVTTAIPPEPLQINEIRIEVDETQFLAIAKSLPMFKHPRRPHPWSCEPGNKVKDRRLGQNA